MFLEPNEDRERELYTYAKNNLLHRVMALLQTTNVNALVKDTDIDKIHTPYTPLMIAGMHYVQFF